MKRWRFLALMAVLMTAFYAVVFQSYSEQSWPGRWLGAYLELTARGSAWALRLLGERVSVEGATVVGRFPFVVVLDCAALDAQSLFAAAVLAFPTPWRSKLLGLAGGLAAIWLINVARLVTLYFAGAHSVRLFEVLHEEVWVLVVILSVCALFTAWALWATRGRDVIALPSPSS